MKINECIKLLAKKEGKKYADMVEALGTTSLSSICVRLNYENLTVYTTVLPLLDYLGYDLIVRHKDIPLGYDEIKIDKSNEIPEFLKIAKKEKGVCEKCGHKLTVREIKKYNRCPYCGTRIENDGSIVKQEDVDLDTLTEENVDFLNHEEQEKEEKMQQEISNYLKGL